MGMVETEEKKGVNVRKIFIIFLVLHTLVWSILPLLRQILPIDAAECVYWGSLMDLGTNKHSPLAGWLAYFVYHIFKCDFSIYLLGQISIITGFIYLYKLGKLFFNKTASMLAVMLMEACFVYTYMGIYDGFNPNFLLLAFLPIISYYFYQSIYRGKTWDWVRLGVFVGLSFLAKYQSLMLFIPLFVYLLITEKGREQFKKKGFYIAAVIGFLIVLPHIIWLIQNDFFSLTYFAACEEKYAAFYHGPLKYLWSPFIFLFNQFIAVAGVLFIYFTALLFSKEKIKKNSMNGDDKKFLICTGVVPILLQSLNGLNGNYMIPQWGYSLLFMSSIILFCFFPFKISNKVIKYMISWVFAAMFITFVVLAIVFTTEKNFANRYPVEKVTNILNEIYESETGQKMKYLGGFIELTIPLSLYNNGEYITVLNTYKHSNPWVDDEDLKKSGVMVIGRNPAYMDEYIEVTVPDIVEKPEVKPFSYTVKSVVGSVRECNMYYAIVRPNSKYN